MQAMLGAGNHLTAPTVTDEQHYLLLSWDGTQLSLLPWWLWQHAVLQDGQTLTQVVACRPEYALQAKRSHRA
jgi:hypothetical protein